MGSFFLGRFLLGWWWNPPQNSSKLPLQDNNIGSAVNEILRYKQTDRQRSCYFSIRIINLSVKNGGIIVEILLFWHAWRREWNSNSQGGRERTFDPKLYRSSKFYNMNSHLLVKFCHDWVIIQGSKGIRLWPMYILNDDTQSYHN